MDRKIDLMWEDDVYRLIEVAEEFNLDIKDFDTLEKMWDEYSLEHGEEWSALPIDNADIAEILSKRVEVLE